MKNKIILAIIIIVALMAVGFLVFRKNTPQPTEGIILFYGDGCSHCKNVDDYIAANKVEEKIKFERKEVFNNKDNAQLLAEKVKQCGLPTDQIGVPFLWDGSKCIAGDQDIIRFFQEKIK